MDLFAYLMPRHWLEPREQLIFEKIYLLGKENSKTINIAGFSQKKMVKENLNGNKTISYLSK